jgi:hypothetical protein
VSEPLDNFLDCTDFDAMEDIDGNIFEQEAPSNFCSIGWVMDELSEKVSINLIAQEIFTLTGKLSVSGWKKRCMKWKKCSQSRRKWSGVYSDANWQKFLDSDVLDPAYPPAEKRTAAISLNANGGHQKKAGKEPVHDPAVSFRVSSHAQSIDTRNQSSGCSVGVGG